MSIKKYIPNTVTCCNLICGAAASGFAFHGEYKLAVLMIVLGAIFDFFDGMSARLLHVSSPIGKELDSLADDITFGLAPSAILFSVLKEMPFPEFLEPARGFVPYLAFVMAAFSALRLAKFNLDERQTSSFIGLPTPANALFWGFLVVGLEQNNLLLSSSNNVLFLLAGIFLLSYLLVAEIPLFALKFKTLSWKDNWPKYIFLIGCLPCFLMAYFWGYICFAAIIVWYVLLAVLVSFKKP